MMESSDKGSLVPGHEHGLFDFVGATTLYVAACPGHGRLRLAHMACLDARSLHRVCLQLESPYWAWLTVWIVAQPTPGMLLSKSLYLVLGTIAGAFFGITLIALFAQTPELFVLALALLIGGCTVASNILTNFRAYAPVLAGYSSGLIASGAINTPDQIFFIGMARTACILTGIASSILVSSLFAPYRAEADVRKKLLGVMKDAARRAFFSWQGSNEERIEIGRKLIFDLIALNTSIEFAAAESGAFRLQANRARHLIAHIFSMISARRSLDAHSSVAAGRGTMHSRFFTRSSSTFFMRCPASSIAGRWMN